MYVKILNDVLLHDAKKNFGNSQWILLQDNNQKHTSHKVQEFLTTNQINFIKPLDWHANSPDLNPIENIWSILKQSISKEKNKNQKNLIKIIQTIKQCRKYNDRKNEASN